MSVTLRLPPVLRTVMNGKAELAGDGGTIEQVLRSLADAYPALGLHLFDEAGAVRRNIICLHENIVVRARDFAGHAVASGDELVMTNLLAGG